MTVPHHIPERIAVRHGIMLKCLGSLMLITCAAIAAFFCGGLRVNVTPSEPMGLWRIRPLDRSVQIGDLVFVCPPVNEVMREARRRGYLRRGLCAGGVAPLIKAVVATAGQRFEITGSVRIDGCALPHSKVAMSDGQGRAMVPFVDGIVPADTIYLHSDFPGSFDSRYFGPLPIDGILGLAQEVWTYAP